MADFRKRTEKVGDYRLGDLPWGCDQRAVVAASGGAVIMNISSNAAHPKLGLNP